MNIRKRYFFAAAVLSACLGFAGCAGHAPVRPVPPPTPPVVKPDVTSHLKGLWKNTAKNGNVRQMVFEAGGKLTFQGGLEFYNPAQWRLDENQKELVLTFPQTPDEKIQVFQLYVNDGVKRVDRPHQQVIYAFDEQTWSLNVAGWMYSKVDKEDAAAPLAEPVLK